jgi:hypothetical protein
MTPDGNLSPRRHPGAIRIISATRDSPGTGATWQVDRPIWKATASPALVLHGVFSRVRSPCTSIGNHSHSSLEISASFCRSRITGRLDRPPILGDADSIATQLAVSNSESTLQYLYDFSLMILYGFVTLVSFLLWIRDRKVGLFLWLALFTATPALLLMLQEFLTSISFGWGRGLNQPIYALNHISLWFLLIYLLRLDSHQLLIGGMRGRGCRAPTVLDIGGAVPVSEFGPLRVNRMACNPFFSRQAS